MRAHTLVPACTFNGEWVYGDHTFIYSTSSVELNSRALSEQKQNKKKIIRKTTESKSFRFFRMFEKKTKINKMQNDL